MRPISIFLSYIVLAIIFYLVFSGIELSLDFREWHIVSRILYVIGAILSFFKLIAEL